MILTPGRVVPDWVLQLAFGIFNSDTTLKL